MNLSKRVLAWLAACTMRALTTNTTTNMRFNFAVQTLPGHSTFRRFFLVMAAGFLASACAVNHPGNDPLTGTRWQLVAVESMSDDQPTQRPDSPARYTLAFAADARVSLQLDCNRASGTWQATANPAQEPGRVSGGLSFGPLASTRAMCPPASLAPQLAQSLPYVRGYLIKDGFLHLTLMADGGILRWEPLR